ncbi:MAG: hypothetical protein CL674_04100 [Bdellovibrionaceae bacterium]|nr:hypothetical protein [Pseudobdellovibrionaceae bacterium]|tara:strand:- start:22942 stop:24354 length:1413 start_codon:yes stop_codon:yes gene_type:complete
MKLFSFLFFFLVCLSVFAGDRKGNGGDVLICEKGSPFHLWSLDWYEMEHRYNLVPKFPGHSSEVKNALVILNRIKEKSPRRYERLTSLVEEFYYRSKFSKHPLSDVRDSGVYEIPPECGLSQVINQNTDILPASKYYLIDENLWQKLTVPMKTSLILHEAIYKLESFKTSENLRKYLSLLIADQFSSFSIKKYNESLAALGFSNNEVNGLEIDLTKDFHFSSDYNLLYAMPIANSRFIFNGSTYTLLPKQVRFYPNTTLASFCPEESFEHKISNDAFQVHCGVWGGDELSIELYPSGKIKAGILAYENFDHQKISLLSSDGVQYSKVKFYENSSIAELDAARVLAVTDKHLYFSDGKTSVQFHENAVLKKVKLSSGSSLKYANGRLLFRGWAEFYDNFHPKKVFVSMDFKYRVQNKNLLFSGGNQVEFYADSGLRSAVLGEGVSLLDVHSKLQYIAPGERVYFNEEGYLH